MKAKHLVILAFFFGLLLAVAMIKKKVEPQRPRFEEKTDIIKNSLSLEALSRIEIKISGHDGQAKSLVFAKADAGWSAPEYFGLPVKAEELGGLVEALDQMEGDLRSATPDVFSDYGISDGEGLALSFTASSGEEVHVVVGTKETASYGQFIRSANSSEVYYTDTNVFYRMGLGPQTLEEDFSYEFWIDKKIFRFPAEKVLGFKEASGGKTLLDVFREDVDGKRKWSFRSGYPVALDAEKVKGFLDTLLSINAVQVKTPEEMLDFKEGPLALVLNTEDGQTVTLVSDEDPADTNVIERTVKVSGFECGFAIPKRDFDLIARDDATFFIENPLKINPVEIATVEVENVSKKSKAILSAGRETVADGDDADTADDIATVWKSNENEISSALPDSLLDALAKLDLTLFGGATGKQIPVLYRFTMTQSDGTSVVFNLHDKTDPQSAAYPVTLADPAVLFGLSDDAASSIKVTVQEIFKQNAKK